MSRSPKVSVWEDSRLRGYLGAVNRRCGVVETLALPTMRDLPPVKIETLFVPPLLSTEAVDADIDSDEWPEGKNLLEALQSSPRLVVLGDPGGGKTTLSNWVAWRLTSGLTSPLPARLQNVIPITCVLREMPLESFKEDVTINGLATYVARKLLGEDKSESVVPVLHEWISRGQFVLILDGIDEIPLQSRAAVARWIREARDSDACVLATSRIIGYNDYPVDSIIKDVGANSGVLDSFLKRILAVHSDVVDTQEIEKVSGAWAEIRYLMPFDKSQISDFVRNWYRQRCTSDSEAKSKTLDLLGALNDSEVTSKLARTPNLLSLMAVVHRERAHLPDGKALLYEEIVNAYLNTIDTQRKIIQDDALGSQAWKDKKSWLSYVGYMMQTTRQNYSEEGILVSERKVISWLIKAMRKSKVSDPEAMAVEFLAWVARRSGLLLPRGEGFYAFVHLSFQEYFCACYIENAIVSPDFFNSESRSKHAVQPSQFVEWANKSAWLETLIFVFEILSSERNDSWIKSLIRIIYPNYPKYSPVDGALGGLAVRILTNKHIKLDHGWVSYLADISCVMLHGGGSDFTNESALASFVSLGLALEIDGECLEKEDSYLSKYEDLDLSGVRILLAKSVPELSSSFLRRFERLFVLDCEECGVIDLSECPTKHLTFMSVQDSKLIGAERIGEFKRLDMLTLIRVDQEGLELVSGSSNITIFLAYHVNLSTANFIAGWKKLFHLDFTGSEISDFSVVGSLRKVSYLTIEHCPVENVDFLASLKSLEYLSLGSCPVKHIPVLRSTRPVTVALTHLNITELSCLSGLPEINGCIVSGCPVIGLDGIKRNNASFLSLSNLPLATLEGIEKFGLLRNLQLKGIDVSDLSYLSGLKGLKMLRLTNVPVMDIDWLKYLKSLTTFHFSGTNIQSVEPLLKLKSLREVGVSDSDEVDVSQLENSSNIVVTKLS